MKYSTYALVAAMMASGLSANSDNFDAAAATANFKGLYAQVQGDLSSSNVQTNITTEMNADINQAKKTFSKTAGGL